ncbi:MAG: TonB-dependent receptor [FCB group bacterium]|nr:TonB-dependent receptor [FCB group bacterium]
MKITSSMIVALMLMASGLFAGTITGTVTGEGGQILDGANVTIEGTSHGTATDSKGNYTILGVASGSYTITVSYIGYEPASRSVTIGPGKATVNFSLTVSTVSAKAVSVIGSRFAHTAEEQAVPVDVFTEVDIRNAGFTETAQIIQALAPSFNMPRTSITDGSDTVRPMTLRGLSSGQVLVLVNGKRRHTTALVHVNNSPSRGDTGVDLNAIPSAAIQRIEVLRDGAAAQYGSDAIAGVINIILKSGDSGGSLSYYKGQNNHKIEALPNGYDLYGFKYGTEDTPYTWNPTTETSYSRDDDGNPHAIVTSSDPYTTNDGQVLQVQMTRGFKLGASGSFLIAGEYRGRGDANRVGFEGEQYYEPNSDFWSDDEAESQRLQPGSNWYIDPFRMQWGDMAQQNAGVMFNAELPLQERNYYAFGGYTLRRGDTGCYSRQPDQPNKVWLSANPTGFVPHIQPLVTDLSLSMGVKGVFGQWAYDLSNVYGKNDFHFFMNSTNASFGPEALREYNIGGFWFDQNTTNLDATTTMGKINLAVGVEHRNESYRIYSGDNDSYSNGQAGSNTAGWDSVDENGDPVNENTADASGGCQCFSGFKPSNEAATRNANRSVFGAYADAEYELMSNFRLGIAGRFENYKDDEHKWNNFSTKLTARYKLTDGIILRGGVSTGFRAPALAQAYQAKIATNFLPDPITGETVAFEVGTFPTSHPFSQALGAVDLKPETSTNLSAGTSLNFGGLQINIDLYNVKIKDRIVLTGTFEAKTIDDGGNELTQKVYDLLQASGETNATGGRFFTNAVDTKTNGIDLTAAYNVDLGSMGNIDLTLGYNKTKTTVEEVRVPTGLSDPTVLELAQTKTFDNRERRTMETAQPEDNLILTAKWSSNSPLGISGTLHRFGKFSSRYEFDKGTPDERPQWFSAKTILDLEALYDLGAITLGIGAKNITDEMPDKILMPGRANDGAFVYPNFSPNGMNGRFFFVKMDYNF